MALVIVAALLLAQTAAAQHAAELLPGDSRLSQAEVQPHRVVWTFVQVRDGVETPVGTFERQMDLVNHTADEPALLARWHVLFPNRSALDIYYLDRQSLAQIARYQTGSNGMWTVYHEDGRLHGTYTRRDGDPLLFGADVEHGVFNSAMLDLVIARLRLEEGEVVRVPVFNASTGTVAENPVAWTTLTWEGSETVRLPDGRTVSARVVSVSRGGRTQRLWVTAEAPYLIRRDILGADSTLRAGWRIKNFSAN